MVLHNPNNWHWVNKDASPWARQWFDDNLTKIEAKEGDVTAKISKVISMDGDVDVAQRKGKVITIFDVKLTLEYTGTYCYRIQSLVPAPHQPKPPRNPSLL
jgi:activator of HSP90 ATPase